MRSSLDLRGHYRSNTEVEENRLDKQVKYRSKEA